MSDKKLNITENAEKITFKQFFRQLCNNILKHNIGKNAASLSYYLIFSLFPLLIFISNFMGLLNLDVYSVTEVLKQVLPNEVVLIIESYLDYISTNSSSALLWFSLVFSIWFPMRTAKGLMSDVRLAYNLEKPKNPIIYTLKQLLYTVVLLVVIALTIMLSFMGKNILNAIKNCLPANAFQIPSFFLGIWQYVRFIPIAVLMFLALGTLYAVSLEKRVPFKTMLPGIFTSLILWLVISLGFTFYVENFSNYSVVYGTLGAVMVLLIWLYATAFVLIFGSEVNACLLFFQQKTKNAQSLDT